MKKQIIKSLALFSLLLVAGLFQTVSAQASVRLVVNVPFEFAVGGERLPAGRYEIGRLSANSDKVLLIRSLEGGRQLAVVTHAADTVQTAEQAQLAFRQYGDRYFLSEIRTASARAARALPISQAEKSLHVELGEAGKGEAVESEDCRTIIVAGILR
jgi:hypothetical protein